MKKIWIGKRESDIETYPYFDYSITFWGSNNGTNYSFCGQHRRNSNYSPEFTQYVIEKLRTLVNDNSDEYQIYFYNNSFAYKLIDIDKSLKPYIKNINSVYIHNLLRHKTLSRLWLSNSVDVPAFVSLSRHECKYENFRKIFPDFERFVLQENYSGGGEGTFIISPININNVLQKLSEHKTYLISPYFENNTSISCTLMIDSHSSTIFPVAQQLLLIDDNIKYCGNRYYDNYENIAKMVKINAQKVGDAIRNMGYRGICGLDWIYTNKKLMLIEVNPRYQGSSFAINEALRRNGIPSLFELNNYCFISEIPKHTKNSIHNLSIQFENHCVFYGRTNTRNKSGDMLFLDGYNESDTFDKNVYLYRYITFPMIN